MSSMFKPATREKLKLRMTIDGPAGSGKTYTALRLGIALASGGRVAVIDTEHGSARKYIGEAPDGMAWTFDVCELSHFAPSTYTACIQQAAADGYAVVVVDSLSHAWEGLGGALDQVDKAKDKSGGNSFAAWKDVTPQHRELVETMLAAPIHVITTMRSKMEYVLEQNEKGKMVPKKVGMKPIQREGMEYEFDVVADMDVDHLLVVSKTRCRAIDGKRVSMPGPEFAAVLKSWLDVGNAPQQQPMTFASPAASATVMVSQERWAAIKELMERLNMPKEARIKALEKRGAAGGPQTLTAVMAEDLFQALIAKAKDCPF